MNAKILYLCLSIILISCSSGRLQTYDDVYDSPQDLTKSNDEAQSNFYNIAYYDPYYYNYSRFGWVYGIDPWTPGWSFGWGGNYYNPYPWGYPYYGYNLYWGSPWWNYYNHRPNYSIYSGYNFDGFSSPYYGHRSSVSGRNLTGGNEIQNRNNTRQIQPTSEPIRKYSRIPSQNRPTNTTPRYQRTMPPTRISPPSRNIPDRSTPSRILPNNNRRN